MEKKIIIHPRPLRFDVDDITYNLRALRLAEGWPKQKEIHDKGLGINQGIITAWHSFDENGQRTSPEMVLYTYETKTAIIVRPA